VAKELAEEALENREEECKLSPEEEIEALRKELEEAKAKASEYLEGWQRTQAEFANYKKRNEKEREEIVKFANAAFITKLLPILDDFERAFYTLPSSLLGLTWIEGILLIHRKLQAIFEGEGVKEIETEGKKFDPLFHQAVTYEEKEGFDDGQIIGEVQKGYKLHDRVLRPALVRVAKGRTEAKPEEKEEKDYG
jgi:molecular chaperone GrpE